ncbi:uncharacterized [Tachysurus ichikawai]
MRALGFTGSRWLSIAELFPAGGFERLQLARRIYTEMGLSFQAAAISQPRRTDEVADGASTYFNPSHATHTPSVHSSRLRPPSQSCFSMLYSHPP